MTLFELTDLAYGRRRKGHEPSRRLAYDASVASRVSLAIALALLASFLVGATIGWLQ